MKIAVIGQSAFGAEVYKLLKKNGHQVVGVFTVPDVNGRADPLATIAEGDGIPVFKFQRWQLKKVAIPEVLDQYRSVDADLNVLPFCSQFIPMEVITHPKHQSIIYHPSLLPIHRGASAINWTLAQGDKKAGFSIFWADDGLDTGPVLLQKECFVDPNDTVESVYNRFLYPEGIASMGEAVKLIEEGRAPRIEQDHSKKTYEPIMKKPLAQIKWTDTAESIHNLIRANDKIPGAWTTINGEKITVFGSRLWKRLIPRGTEVKIEGAAKSAIVHRDGMVFFGSDGKMVNVNQVQFESGKMIPASKFGAEDDSAQKLELTDEEVKMIDNLKDVWVAILNTDIEATTDFFKSGGKSMDVVRLVEEIKEKCNGVALENDDVYMNTTFEDLSSKIVRVGRGISDKPPFTYDAIEIHKNNMDLKFPHQVFINNEFAPASNGDFYNNINPTDESVICEVSKATAEDVAYAVEAAKVAFEEGEWGRMNARDRGTLMYRLADLMDAHKEELATLETIDSGAVYTLALKTHIGMSIDTWRYFAGWCDKIQGSTIPINHARPSRNLTYTKREPLGVCGIVVPWNYPLMMLSWKMAACIAAGNTVVLKPAQVTPLTALKFAELVVHAGFPPGVINILPGSGTVVGQAIADHPDVRKLGFTGSTSVGKTIMESCAKSNLKKCSLELGGKSPLIIFDDCDLDKAVRMGCGAVFFNKGENCIAAGRIFVEETIHDEFIDKVVAEVKRMKIGDPLLRSTDHGPQNHRSHLNKLVEFCEVGQKEGATLVYGGKQVDRQGLFMTPTIFTDVLDHHTIAEEESFGPVMIVSKFYKGDVEGVLKRANTTEFGLASGVFTKDIDKALYVADNLQAGTVFVNTYNKTDVAAPFGGCKQSGFGKDLDMDAALYVASNLQAGTMFVNTYNKTDVAAPFGGCKQSGFGKDLGQEALNEYLKTKAVTLEYS